MENKILVRAYFRGTVLLCIIFAGCCLLLEWQLALLWNVLIACLAFSFPVVLTLHFLFFIKNRLQVSRSFLWMVLMASIPLLVLIPADLFATTLPGKEWFLAMIGVLTSYVAILTNGNDIAQTFKTSSHE